MKELINLMMQYFLPAVNETSIVDGHRCHVAAKFVLFVDELLNNQVKFLIN